MLLCLLMLLKSMLLKIWLFNVSYHIYVTINNKITQDEINRPFWCHP